jgi:general secretion pathway protein D
MMKRLISPALVLALALNGCAGRTATRHEAPAPPAQAADAPAPAAAAPAPAPAPPAASAEPAAPPVVPIALKPATAPPAPAAPAAPAPPPAEKAADKGPAAPERYVSLNFDNADISVVIQTIAELLHLNYIVSPSVRGRITIQTTDKLPVSSLLPVLEQILEVNNFTAVKSGIFYKIVPANQAKQELVETVLPSAVPSVSTGMVTKVAQLRYISPGEVVKVLTPFKTAAGLYQAHEASRLLFLTETPAKIADLMKIVELLDVDSFASIQVELYPVRYAGVEDLARELTQIVTQVFSATGRGRSLFRIVPVPQIGALMVFSGEPGLAANVREWIAKLDQPASEANERIFVYPLSHATAETLAAVIEKVFRRDAAKTSGKSAAAAQPVAAPSVMGQRPAAPGTTVAPAPAPAMAAAAAPSDGVASASSASVVVVADKDTNALIIQTASWFYPAVEEVIKKLDVMPKQVLIEVLIAEITLDDTTQFGIQWALKGQGAINVAGENHGVQSLTQNIYGGVSPASTGFSFFLTEANRLTAALNAYAKDSKLNILSAPHILATNNKEAKIDVGSEVPILKRTTSDPNNASLTTTTSEIEYRSTGVILTVTPHINEGGYVTLDLQQEVSEAQTNTLGGTDSPIIRKRTAKTTMVVKDQQTLVVGGLILENRDGTREGIPGLNKLPVIGYLFGSTKSHVVKTELVLLISPRVVNNVAEGDALTEQVKERVLTLKEGIGQFGVKRKLEEFHPLQEKKPQP